MINSHSFIKHLTLPPLCFQAQEIWFCLTYFLNKSCNHWTTNSSIVNFTSPSISLSESSSYSILNSQYSISSFFFSPVELSAANKGDYIDEKNNRAKARGCKCVSIVPQTEMIAGNLPVRAVTHFLNKILRNYLLLKISWDGEIISRYVSESTTSFIRNFTTYIKIAWVTGS